MEAPICHTIGNGTPLGLVIDLPTSKGVREGIDAHTHCWSVESRWDKSGSNSDPDTFS